MDTLRNHLAFVPAALMALALAAGASFVSTAYATSLGDIVFPVAELDNCADKNACKAYCNELSHAKECTAFALKHGLMSQEDARRNESLALPAGGGPGGCTSHNECRTYCENTAHIDECVAFAERHNVMPERELAEYKKVARALKGGAKLPGGCTSQAQCQAYCESGNHMEECLAFGEAAGILSSEELQEARRIMPLMKAGKMPGGCRSKAQCEAHCANEANIMECANFAVEAGFMTPQEAEMAKKTGGKGPGGCRGRECETFCSNPANREACVAFSMEHGLMPEEDMQRMRESGAQVQKMISEMPTEVASCLRGRIGADAFQKMQSGAAQYLPDVSEHMSACSREHTAGGDVQQGGNMPSMPPEMHRCLAERLGSDFNKVEASRFDPAMRECIEIVRSQMESQHQRSGSMPPMQPPEGYRMPVHGDQQYPPYGAPPPEGHMPPSDGSMPPDAQYYDGQQQSGEQQPAPEEMQQEGGTSEPTSLLSGNGLLANIISIVQRLLGR